jgi:hypothetical protein
VVTSQHNQQVALKWAAAGAHILVTGPDKKARIKWRDHSTTNAKTIESWFAQWPDSLPAIDLARSDIVVIDGDRHGGPDGVAAVEAMLAKHNIVATKIPTVITPSDGRHYWFRQPPDSEPLGNSDKAVKDSGINIRGDGGYVIAPGAMLPDGRRYKRDITTPSTIVALQDQAIPVLPPAIVAVLRKPGEQDPPPKINGHAPHSGSREEAYARATLESLARELAAKPPDSGRNIELNNAAMRLGHMVAAGWIGRTTVEGRLLDAAAACGLVKDDGAHSVRATIKSGLDAGEKEPAGALPDRDGFALNRQPLETNDNSDEPANGQAERATITIEAGNLHAVVTQAEAALIAAGTPFYARGGELVKPIIEEVAAFRGRRTKVARLKPVSADMLRDHLSRAIDFQRFDKRSEEMVSVNPPHEVAQTLLSRDGDWRFAKLTGIITTPTMRPDGSILSAPGYDRTTGLLLMAPLAMPPIPAQPNWNDALAALKLLEQLLTEFPFADKASHAVALSALMTPVARGAMQCTPLHAVAAPEAGSGKSFLIDIASCIGTGEVAPVIAAGRNEEETEKRLAAELMTGQPIISIDNLNGDLAGDFICQAVERPIIKPRILGRSETRRIDNTVTIYGNGNNFRLAGDLTRRVILCSLDANMERPELRKFSADPVAAVLADRGCYVAAVLTIVRAYLAADCPGLCPPLASFADWSRLVRSPLVWLGHDDPVMTMEAARAEDPTKSALAEIVTAWRSVIGTNRPMTAGEIRDKATSADDKDGLLNKAISAIACPPARTEIDAKRLGHWLRRNKDRVISKHKIQAGTDKHSKQQIWWLAAL